VTFQTALKRDDATQLADLFVAAKGGNHAGAKALVQRVLDQIALAAAPKTAAGGAAGGTGGDGERPVICKIQDVSLMNPRGKFDLTFHDTWLHIAKPNGKEVWQLQVRDVIAQHATLSTPRTQTATHSRHSPPHTHPGSTPT
jgi:hypothetical protein